MAHEAAAGTRAQLVLPALIFGPVELRRLLRELESLEEFMLQAGIRTPGKQPLLPKTSRLLENVAEANKLNFLLPEDRQKALTFLQYISKEAPVVHISFAADPSAAFTAKIVTWFRENIHPHTLIQLGLQPNLAAGCIVRTNNKAFDFSLRNHFQDKRGQLLEAISSKNNKDEAAA